MSYTCAVVFVFDIIDDVQSDLISIIHPIVLLHFITASLTVLLQVLAFIFVLPPGFKTLQRMRNINSWKRREADLNNSRDELKYRSVKY